MPATAGPTPETAPAFQIASAGVPIGQKPRAERPPVRLTARPDTTEAIKPVLPQTGAPSP